MNTWVQWLCYVCSLKPEDPPTDIPEPKPMTTSSVQGLDFGGAAAASSGGLSNGQLSSSMRPSLHQALSSSPASSSLAGASASSSVPRQHQPFHHPVHSLAAGRLSDSSLSPYIPLEDCHTGEPPARRESVESVPDFRAPSPPMKQKTSKAAAAASVAADDDVFVVGGTGSGEAGNGDHGLYDHPPPSSGSRRINLLSTVPLPARPMGNASDDESSKQSYDVPPSAFYHNQSPRRKSDRPDSQASSDDQGLGGPTECYDYPPRRIDSTASSDNELIGPTPPARPPKPGHLISQYQNLPSRKSEAGKLAHGNSLRGHPTPPVNADPADLMNMVVAPPKPHSIRQGSGYDVPRSSGHRPVRTNQQRSTALSSTVVPPPPIPRRPSDSGSSTPLYLNTPSGDGSLSVTDLTLSENGTGVDATDSALGLVPPAIPPPRHGSSGESQDSRSDRDSPQPMQQSPAAPAIPPARPPGRVQAPAVSPRVHDTTAQEQRDEGGMIFSNQRTRSFKRQYHINHGSPKMSHKSKSQTLPMAVHVPAPRPVVSARALDTSTSDDEDDAMRQRLRIPDQEEETHHSLSLLHSVPPAVNDDKQLKYIDLALPDASQDHHTPTPRSSHAHSHAGVNHTLTDQATEYREIDFVKTQALSNAKREKEKERQGDDHN
ncbi:protein daughter of sevenless [Elysia marginata]|uniref:Protein daughter of sevenless n=1 Tax=Elysia marginata TaxID=1093978 RepID=A0AAV4H3U2_9GAST|nr:protein daughter of sevenless [Elysia marginata]